MGTNLKYAIKSWVNASSDWRRGAIAVTAVYGSDGPDPLWLWIAKRGELLRLEGEEIAAALDDQATVVNARRSKILRGISALMRADAALLAASTDISPRAFGLPASGGGLPGLRGMKGLTDPMTWAAVGNAFKKILVTLGIIGAAAGTLGVAYTGYRVFLRSPAERAAEDIEVLRITESSRQADLARCASDADPDACRDRINEMYDRVGGASCGDILDTPLGSLLGLIVGVGGGYVIMRKLMGWT